MNELSINQWNNQEMNQYLYNTVVSEWILLSSDQDFDTHLN